MGQVDIPLGRWVDEFEKEANIMLTEPQRMILAHVIQRAVKITARLFLNKSHDVPIAKLLKELE